MSFKKKTVVISGNSGVDGPRPDRPANVRTPIITGRVPIRGGPISRGHPVPTRTPPGIGSTVQVPTTTSPKQVPTSNQIMNHEGVRPSLQTSSPTVSIGSVTLDKLMGHGGLPLGSVLAIEESGSTDFASIILRSFAAQGIVHARLTDEKKQGTAPTKIVVVGADDNWGSELPGIYKDKKEAARELMEKEQSKVSVGNLANNPSSTGLHTPPSASENEASTESTETTPNKGMKIAWRYAPGPKSNTNDESADNSSSSKPNFTTQFDFTSRLIPRPNTSEIAYLQLKTTFSTIIAQLEIIAQQAISNNTIVRVVIPSLLHPAIYPPHLAHPNELIPFIHSLRNLCRRYSQTLAVILSLPLQLFPRDNALIRWFELLSDGVLHLEPFPEEIINELKEANAVGATSSSTKSLSNTNTNQSQGLVHIYKLPLSSERGVMAVRKGEHAFRVGRRQFEVQEWGIPVDDSPGPNDDQSAKKLDY